MRKATQEDFDDIFAILLDVYEESIWKELGPYDYETSGQYIRDVIDSNETYIGDGLISINISQPYHKRPIASVVWLAAPKKARNIKTVNAMFRIIDNVCLAHNCLAVFFIPDTILSGAFQSSFSNMMQKRGYTVFSNMYWRSLNG